MTSYTGVSAKLVFTNDCLAIMEPLKRCYKWCFVPMCTNTTFTTPEKTFLTMPRDVKIRKMWFKAARRDYSKITPSDFYCCEDHFDFFSCKYVLTFVTHAFTITQKGTMSTQQQLLQNVGRIKTSSNMPSISTADSVSRIQYSRLKGPLLRILFVHLIPRSNSVAKQLAFDNSNKNSDKITPCRIVISFVWCRGV
ncbi:hypothetical protein RI129_012097 [Pyrocoelia pectoralis]|uniref:THAP-type domain-containing protein n=1 Tax=Pyrocoelia pectoralis TaxID=417401 RepID=A0AAN7Z8F9_9COLE